MNYLLIIFPGDARFSHVLVLVCDYSRTVWLRAYQTIFFKFLMHNIPFPNVDPVNHHFFEIHLPTLNLWQGLCWGQGTDQAWTHSHSHMMPYYCGFARKWGNPNLLMFHQHVADCGHNYFQTYPIRSWKNKSAAIWHQNHQWMATEHLFKGCLMSFQLKFSCEAKRRSQRSERRTKTKHLNKDGLGII